MRSRPLPPQPCEDSDVHQCELKHSSSSSSSLLYAPTSPETEYMWLESPEEEEAGEALYEQQEEQEKSTSLLWTTG